MTKADKQNQLQARALEAIGDEKNVGIAIGTGGGKTLLGLKHMAKQYNDLSAFLIAVPKKVHASSWINDAKKHGYEYLLDHIQFTTYRSLQKQSINYDWLYADECHSFTENHSHWLKDFENNEGSIMGLSGTYPTKGIKAEICNKYCPKVFSFSVDDGVEQGILNDYRIYVHMITLGNKNDVLKTNKKGGKWRTTEKKDYWGLTKAINDAHGKKKMMLRIFRMKSMQTYPSKERYANYILDNLPKKALLFANTKEQADKLCKHSYHSGNKESDKNLKLFSEGFTYRLSCVDQLSESVTINDLQVGVIMHAYSNPTKTQQRIGRFLRLAVDKTAYIHIICFEDTIDKQWVENALESFDQSKIKYHRRKKK